MRAAEIMSRFTADTLQLHHRLDIEHKNADIQRANYYTAMAVAAALMLALMLAVWMLRERKRHYENRIRTMNMKLDNVRNRISPHFMFNVLNNKIAGAEKEEASELTALARLIRTNLDMSGKPCVTLESELDFVRQYIDVESYLLGDSFTAEIDIADGVDTRTTMIPSMFVQILTENAIVHGLRGLDGEKRLRINVSRTDGGTTVCVSDNGRGFNPQSLRRKTGLGIISQTIAVANERNKQKMRFDIRNITAEDGTTAGCKATLHVPDGIKI